MTTKQRAYLKGLAMNLDPIFQIGKVQRDTRADCCSGRGTGGKRTDQVKHLKELSG